MYPIENYGWKYSGIDETLDCVRFTKSVYTMQIFREDGAVRIGFSNLTYCIFSVEEIQAIYETAKQIKGEKIKMKMKCELYLETLLFSKEVAGNPSIKDYMLNGKIANWDTYDNINSFTINNRKVDIHKTIIDEYKIYPTFEYDSGIEMKSKEIVWEDK